MCRDPLVHVAYRKQDHSFKSHFGDFVEKRIGGMISYGTLPVGTVASCLRVAWLTRNVLVQYLYLYSCWNRGSHSLNCR